MTENLKGSPEDVETLLSTETIRRRAAQIFARAQQGMTHFEIHLERLPQAVDLVAQISRERYPSLEIPFHSRWQHFQVGGVDRRALLDEKLSGVSAEERGRAKIDLAIVSVLLDAGAGPQWRYLETSSGKTFSRSEGLAVASFHLFLNGHLSSNPGAPCEVDADGLSALSSDRFARAFQVGPQNPLEGIHGRLTLLRSLAVALDNNPQFFSLSPRRPGGLLNHFAEIASDGKLEATQILTALQKSLGSIWPGRTIVNGFNLGDVWSYAPLGNGLERLVPFHKLSQWLTYSLVDPLLEYGFKISGFEELTGLAEYRNGGLLLDTGVLSLRNPEEAGPAHPAGSELIVEWRALTIVLLDKIADQLREKFGKSAEELPLGAVLEGGTWWAGRRTAEKRPGAVPPLQLKSDGTVF